MNLKKIIYLIGLNLLVAIVNIAIFSNSLLNIRINGTDALKTAIGYTSFIMSIFIFFYGNFKLLFGRKAEPLKINEISNAEDCITILQQNFGKKTFDEDISLMIEQTERLKKKREKISNALLQHVNVVDKTYETFNDILVDVEFVFFANVKSILNKINVFDEEEYRRLSSLSSGKRFSKNFIANKESLFNEYIGFVKNAIEDNEQIILKLDRLLLEISNMDSLESGELENMKEMKELDNLIKKSRIYR